MRTAFLDSGKCRSVLQFVVNSRRGTLWCFDELPLLQNKSWKPGIAKCKTFHYSCTSYRENSTFQQQKLGEQGNSTIQGVPRPREGAWNDTLLSSSVALSASSESKYLFISDTHHHRVIIADRSGKILDCIGSSPGMLDGSFDIAELQSPAATLFDPRQKYLYIADSENHAIRRADLTERTVVTVYPPTLENKKLSLWERLLGWVGSTKPHAPDQKDYTFENANVLKHPRHLRATEDETLLVASHSFECIWDLNLISGGITTLQSSGCEARWEEYLAKGVTLDDLERVNTLLLQASEEQKVDTESSWQSLSPLDLVSRAARVQNTLFFVGTDRTVRTYDLLTLKTGILQLSNLGRLGLPSWWPLHSPNKERSGCSLTIDQAVRSTGQDNDSYRINVQPGRRLLCICPVLRSGTTLATPLQEGSICRQARGSVVELSMFGGSLMSPKVSSAQQWLDDLDDLEKSDAETEDVTIPERSPNDSTIFCLIDSSLGGGEVIVDAVLYLKSTSSEGFIQEGNSLRSPESSRGNMYLRHLHVKIHLEIGNASSDDDKINRIDVQV